MTEQEEGALLPLAGNYVFFLLSTLYDDSDFASYDLDAEEVNLCLNLRREKMGTALISCFFHCVSL